MTNRKQPDINLANIKKKDELNKFVVSLTPSLFVAYPRIHDVHGCVRLVRNLAVKTAQTTYHD